MRIVFWLCWVICTVLPIEVAAQSKLIVNDKRKFVLQSIDSKGVISGDIIIALDGTYESDSNQFTISYGSGGKVELNYPVNRFIFASELSALLNKGAEEPKTFTTLSLDAVYMWIISLRPDEVGPTTGRLELGNITQPIERSYLSNTPNRIALLENVSYRLTQLHNNAKSQKERYLTTIQSLIELFAADKSDTDNSKKKMRC